MCTLDGPPPLLFQGQPVDIAAYSCSQIQGSKNKMNIILDGSEILMHKIQEDKYNARPYMIRFASVAFFFTCFSHLADTVNLVCEQVTGQCIALGPCHVALVDLCIKPENVQAHVSNQRGIITCVSRVRRWANISLSTASTQGKVQRHLGKSIM